MHKKRGPTVSSRPKRKNIIKLKEKFGNGDIIKHFPRQSLKHYFCPYYLICHYFNRIRTYTFLFSYFCFRFGPRFLGFTSEPPALYHRGCPSLPFPAYTIV